LQKHKPLPVGLAIFFLAFLLASLAARFWAGQNASRYSGPTHIAAGAGQVWVFAAGELFQLTSEGELVATWAAAVTGLNSDPIDLRVLPDGRLLLAVQEPAEMRLCHTAPWQCESILSEQVSSIARQFKVIPDLRPGAWLMTDARGDTLWALQDNKEQRVALVPKGMLAGPNDLVFDGSGSLWIADTDNRRLVEVLPGSEGAYVQGRQLSAVNELTHEKRWYPMMLAVTPDQKFWVAQAADFSQPWSDLVVYDPDEGAEKRVELPRGAYATDVVTVGAKVLVTDLERYVVYQVDSRTFMVSEFGDETFSASLERIGESRKGFERLGSLSLISLAISAVLMIGFAVLATPAEKRWSQQAAAFDPEKITGEVPPTRRVYWLRRDPKAENIFKWAERIFHGSLVGLVVFVLALYSWIHFQVNLELSPEQDGKSGDLGMVLLLGGLMVALLVPVVRLTGRALSRKLGTDGKRLFIRLEDGRELAVDPSQLVYTQRMLHYRRYTIPLQGGVQQALYMPGELDTWLAPLLREARKVSAWQEMKHQWKYRDNLLISILIAATAAGLLLLTIYMLDI